MNILKGLAVAAAFAFASAAMPASAGVIVGANQSGNCYPFMCNDSGSSTGQSFDYYEIYNAAAFGSSAVKFDTITFYDYAPQPGLMLNGAYDISFGITPSLSSGFPVSMSNVQSFFLGDVGGNPGASSIVGSNYVYNPNLGDLVMHVVVNNQANVCNGCGNGYNAADYTGLDVVRAYNGGGTGVGALVTGFNTTPAVPEPATWAMMLLGIGGLGAALRSRRRTVLA